MPDEKKKLINPGATVLEKLMPLVVIAIAATILAPTYIFLLQPELKKYLSGGEQNVQTAQEFLDKRKSYADQLKPLQELYEQYGSGSQANVIETIMPSDLDVATIYATFERIGRDLDIGVQSIDIGNVDGASSSVQGVKSVIISMKISGVGYEKMKDILRYLETTMRLTDVNVIDFDPRSKFLSLTMRVYYTTPK